jgi:hypothetical protein
MLAALPAKGERFWTGPPTGVKDARTRGAVEKFQEWRNAEKGAGLAVDGDPGPETRRALITAYMELDGTTVPQGIEVVAHGCGEGFPAVATGNGVAAAENRRVEIFCFDGPITPPPPGKTSPKGSTAYPRWHARVTQDIDVGMAGEELVPFEVQLHDDTYEPCADVPFRMLLPSGAEVGGVTDGAGWAHALVAKSTKEVVIEYPWSDAEDHVMHTASIVIADRTDDSDQSLLTQLGNLGFRQAGDDERTGLLRYQAHMGLPRTGTLDDDTRSSLQRALAGGDDSVKQELRV